MSDKVQQTQKWVQEVVVRHNFCPFAHPVVKNDAVRYQIIAPEESESLLRILADECAYLEAHPEVATTLLVFETLAEDFYDFLDCVAEADHWIEASRFYGVFQLATFHPDYVFAGSQYSDPANFTNRSPFPMLHILREEELETALANWREPEQIPERNIRLAREKGGRHFADILQQIRGTSSKR